MNRLLTVLLSSGLLLVAPATAAGPTWLVRVDRADRDDLATLTAAGLDVVLDMRLSLAVVTDTAGLDWLREHGYGPEVLDADPEAADYVVVGVRPDSDVAAVRSLGPVLLEEENWVLVRVPRGQSLEPLAGARVFVTRVGHEPLRAPRPLPPEPDAASTEVGEDGAPDPLVQQLVDAVDESAIDAYWNDLTANPPTGTRYSPSAGCDDAAAYCKSVYEGLDISAEYHVWSGTHAPNVVGTRLGAVHPDDVYIAVGHLDDLPSTGSAPGADDNASGSVFVLEAARALQCSAFRSTIRFLNVTGEEQGLLGSDAWAEQAEQRGENILGVVNMDMPGWEGDGIPAVENLDVSYNTISEDLALRFADAAGTYGTGLSVDAFYCPSLTASDHYSFWRRGWPAIIGITDNEGYCGHGGNYPYYHTSSDTIANCGNPSFFYAVIRTGVATLAELAGPFRVTFARDRAVCDGPVRVLVGDRDLNTDPATVETVTISVWSDTETSPEALVLTEEGVDSMLFSADLVTSPGPPAPGDGILAVVHGDTLSARYTDAVDCDGSLDVDHTATATADCLAPLISAVGEQGVTDVAATVVWATNEASDSVVHWGPSIPPVNVATGAGDTTAHQVGLSGLTECTVYYYDVRSEDGAGNLAVDDNGGQYHRFETLVDFGSGLQSCHGGKLELARPVLGCDDTLDVQVSDLDLDTDPGTVETVEVSVSSSTETDPEVVVLTETGVSSAVFTGTLTTSPGTPVAGDGLLQASDGDLVTATYRDLDDGTGSVAVSFATAVADCDGPRIQDLVVDPITNARLHVTWTTSEPADSAVEWGATPALGQVTASGALTTTHDVVLNQFDHCETVHLRVKSTDEHGNLSVADSGGSPHAVDTWTIPGLYWRDTLESGAPGWTLNGEWEVGTPLGLGGSSGDPDPGAAYNHAAVLGTDLAGQGGHPGDYEPGSFQTAASPILDASTWTNTRLLLYRHLNVGASDTATISVWRGFATPVFSNDGQTIRDTAFQPLGLDIANLADGEPQVRLQISLSADAVGQYSGWNIDDVILKDGSQPDYAACGGCASAPSFAGAASAGDRDGCAATGVLVTWPPAAGWGTGVTGTYAVYRGTAPDFVPGAGNRLAEGLSDTSWVDTAPPTDQDLYYVVRAENDETCAAGPANGGVTDANLVRAHGRDDTAQANAGDVGATVQASPVNRAHVRLSWQASPGADRYRVERADAPGGVYQTVGEVEGLVFEDRDELGNLNSRYYRVVALDSCGTPGS